MTAYTLTKNTTLRDLTVAGGYSARSGGDSITNTNGWSLTIDQDTQYGHGSPAIAAATSGSLGSITQTAASGGDILVDSRFVRLIPFDTGSGTLAIDGSTQTIGSATCVAIGVYTAMNVAPTNTGASGWLKVTAWNGVDFPTSGSFTKSGFTFTITGPSVPGWIEIVGDDAATMTLNRLGKFQVRGAYYELGTTDGNRATTYQVPNNGKQLYVPAIEVQGAAWTITGATWSAGVATFTTSAPHDMLVGQPGTVTGVTPSGYNCVDQFITDLTASTFSVAMSDPGAYVSGGTAQAYEQYPCAGTLACTAVNWVANEDTRRGKVFWNTNATTSLTLPTGVVRFGHDGTNSAGAYCPPAGRKIRIPNAIFTNCTTAARNQNVLPNVALATRYDFTTNGAGQVDIDKACMCWFPTFTQSQSLSLTNSGFMSQLFLTEIPTRVVMKNVAIGQQAAVAAVNPITTSFLYAGGTWHNVVGTMAATTGTSNGFCWNISTTDNLVAVDCVGWCFAFRTGGLGGKMNQFTTCPDLVLTRFHTINQGLNWNNCANMLVEDTKFTDTTGLRQSTQSGTVFSPVGALSSGAISGLRYVGYRAQAWGGLFAPSSSLRGPFKFRNMGTYANPLETGDGPYRDVSWARTTTVCTVTHVAHGLIVGENIVVPWNSSTSAIAAGAKVVATVPTADTYTFACTNSGDASGTLTYYVNNQSGLLLIITGANYTNLSVQRCYLKFLRGSFLGSDNSNSNVSVESSFITYDPCNLGISTYAILNGRSKFGIGPSQGISPSTYGTNWIDGPIRCLADVDTYTWTRSGAVVTATTTSGYHNLQAQSTEPVEVIASSDEAALNLGYYTLTVPGTSGDTANKFRLTSYAVGGTSGTATIRAETGRVALFLNENSATGEPQYTFTAGNPLFTGAGTLRMPTVGDQVVFETPDWIRGHTAFTTNVPSMSTATIANFWLEYQIDTGSGYGPWRTAFRQTTTNVAAGTAGAATITSVPAAANWIADGDYVQNLNWGQINRSARVASGGGTTTLTMTKNHNTTFSSAGLKVFRMPAEVIDADVGFKLKLRITTLIAGAGASNTVGPIIFPTLTTNTSRQVVSPLDTSTIQVNNLVTGSQVKATKLVGGDVLFNGAESGGAINFTTDFTGTIVITARKGTGTPTYFEWVTQVNPVLGSTISATALQVRDDQ